MAVAKKPTAADLRNRRKMERLAEIFQFGKEQVVQAARDAAPIVHAADMKKSLEAEAVLLFVAVRGKGFNKKFCKQCKQEFLHTYTIVAYCSDHCRSESLKALGIEWNPYAKNDIERWDNRMPMVIGPYATEVALKWLEKNPEQPELALEVPEPPKPPKPPTLSPEEELDKLLGID
jgi:hypothetical protein